MALKNWKKIKFAEDFIEFRKLDDVGLITDEITIKKINRVPEKNNNYSVSILKDKDFIFKTKSQVFKFVKEYMQKH